jgi:hypothetical protein
LTLHTSIFKVYILLTINGLRLSCLDAWTFTFL